MSNYYQSPNNSQPFGPAPQPQQQPVIMVAANRNRALGIIMVVLMVLLVAVLGLIGWLYFNRTYQGHAPVLLKTRMRLKPPPRSIMRHPHPKRQHPPRR